MPNAPRSSFATSGSRKTADRPVVRFCATTLALMERNDRGHLSCPILSAASLRTADRELASSDPRQIPVTVELNPTGRVLRSVCRFLLGSVGFDNLSYEFCQFHGEFESSDYWRLGDLVRSDILKSCREFRIPVEDLHKIFTSHRFTHQIDEQSAKAQGVPTITLRSPLTALQGILGIIGFYSGQITGGWYRSSVPDFPLSKLGISRALCGRIS